MDRQPTDITIFSAPFHDQRQLSHVFLRRAAARYAGLSEEVLGEVVTNPWGKPSFSQRQELCFSITHSGEWWLCAFSRQAVGLDLQIHHTHKPPQLLSRRFFHPLEDTYLAKADYVPFFDVWSAKESWVKYTGRGFSYAPGKFSVVSPEGEFPAIPGVELRLLPFPQPDYSLCLCAQRIGSVTFEVL